jgi:hypothetical protein
LDGDVRIQHGDRGIQRNIHWFVAEKDASATLDVIVSDVNVNGKAFKLDFVDAERASWASKGLIRASLIDADESRGDIWGWPESTHTSDILVGKHGDRPWNATWEVC